MTWVRYDDQASIHRKVAPLDDATYRLWREAIEWCSRNLTDGRIAADELSAVSKRARADRAAKLVARDLWHTADTVCGSERCPQPGPDGWVIHDYWDYQPSRAKVRAEQKMKAERQQRWVARQVARRVSNASKDIAPSRPVPPRKEGDAREPPNRCPQHLDDPNPPPCGHCADARHANQRWHADRRQRAERAPKCRQHRGQPADNCALCRSEQLAERTRP